MSQRGGATHLLRARALLVVVEVGARRQRRERVPVVAPRREDGGQYQRDAGHAAEDVEGDGPSLALVGLVQALKGDDLPGRQRRFEGIPLAAGRDEALRRVGQPAPGGGAVTACRRGSRAFALPGSAVLQLMRAPFTQRPTLLVQSTQAAARPQAP
jgi:hypothetical protein